jgi:adenosylcobinamide kinase/adenosylcobinamide-phosphate guanylyltransferase
MTAAMSPITLITGGARSGKSRYALELARERGERKAFIATAQALDEEMKIRIVKHQEERGREFLTVEEPLWLSRAVNSLSAEADVLVVDCLTLWLSNLIHYFGEKQRLLEEQIELLLQCLKQKKTSLILITSEAGSGIIPDNALARQFLDRLGKLNQSVAERADEVIWMILGIPQHLKGAGLHAGMDSSR